MHAGSLDRRITIQRAAETRGTDGSPTLTWADYMASEPAAFKPDSGSEGEQGDQLQAVIRGTFTIRSSNASKAITQADRILFDSKTWNIDTLNPYGRKERIEITAHTAY